MHDSLQAGSVAKLYATLWRYAEGRRRQVVLYVVLLVLAQVVRLTIPWFFGEAVNALQAHGMGGLTQARNDLLLMLAAVGVAWTMPRRWRCPFAGTSSTIPETRCTA